MCRFLGTFPADRAIHSCRSHQENEVMRTLAPEAAAAAFVQAFEEPENHV